MISSHCAELYRKKNTANTVTKLLMNYDQSSRRITAQKLTSVQI